MLKFHWHRNWQHTGFQFQGFKSQWGRNFFLIFSHSFLIAIYLEIIYEYAECSIHELIHQKNDPNERRPSNTSIYHISAAKLWKQATTEIKGAKTLTEGKRQIKTYSQKMPI